MLQTKRELALGLLAEMFLGDQRIAIADAVAAAAERGVSRKTLTRAGKELGVRHVNNGPYGGFWERVVTADKSSEAESAPAREEPDEHR